MLSAVAKIRDMWTKMVWYLLTRDDGSFNRTYGDVHDGVQAKDTTGCFLDRNPQCPDISSREIDVAPPSPFPLLPPPPPIVGSSAPPLDIITS